MKATLRRIRADCRPFDWCPVAGGTRMSLPRHDCGQEGVLTLRPAVLWRKSSFWADSAAGCRFAERLLTG